MLLSQLSLQNFRSYTKKEFTFDPHLTIIVGPNTAGKTNCVEAIYLMSNGKSFRSEKEKDLLHHGASVARIKAEVGDTKLEIVFAAPSISAKQHMSKKYLVNEVPRRRVDFVGKLPLVLFTPLDLDIVIGSPGQRRRFLDDVLEQVDHEYRLALFSYEKGIRQRNALLEQTRELGRRDPGRFEYWDKMVIENGQKVTSKREAFIEYINSQKHTVFPFRIEYDKSIISKERLEQYKDAEVGAAVTLVGPHRDDMFLYMDDGQEEFEVKSFGSRGQQRLVVLQLKLLQLSFMEERLGERPLLLLDDIFSELDSTHITLVLDTIGKQQTIMTTTHKEFIADQLHTKPKVIELSQ